MLKFACYIIRYHIKYSHTYTLCERTCTNKFIYYHGVFAEEVILAEERTTEEEKMHIMEGLLTTWHHCRPNKDNDINVLFLARRRNAAKRKKLKSLGKSKSTDTEEEEAEEDYGDDGKNRVRVWLKDRTIEVDVCMQLLDT